jgi:hypothetical protein
MNSLTLNLLLNADVVWVAIRIYVFPSLAKLSGRVLFAMRQLHQAPN